MDPLAPDLPPPRAFPWWGVLPVVLPWLWFIVRDHGAWTDPVAIALPAIAFVAFLAWAILTFFHRWVAAATALSLLAVCLVAIVGPRLPQRTAAPVRPIRIVSDNVFNTSQWPGLAAQTMTSRGADVIVSVEMGRSYWEHLQEYTTAYPYTAIKSEQSILSRWPVEALPLADGLPEDRIMRAALDVDGERVIVYVVHLFNPTHETTFDAQQRLLDQLVGAMDAETDPVIVAGDLNLSDRSEGYRMLDDHFADAMRTGWWAGSTYRHGLWRALLLRIDQILVPLDWCTADAETFRVPGSDHMGVQATVGPCV